MAAVARAKVVSKRVALRLHLTLHRSQFRRQANEFRVDCFHVLRHQVDEI